MSSTFRDCRHLATLSYLAGLLEGEGSFQQSPPSNPAHAAVALEMTDEDVVERAALLLEARCNFVARRQVHYRDTYTVRVRGRRAVEVMEALQPLMGIRRRQQMAAALATRTITSRRVPYSTEISAMADLRERGITRQELAVMYGITPTGVDGLLLNGGRHRSLNEACSRARQIADAEAVIAAIEPDYAWLAGLAEGEAHFAPEVALKLEMTDRDVIERAAELMGGAVTGRPPRRRHWAPTWQVKVTRQRARDLAEKIYPLLGARRRAQVQTMLASPSGYGIGPVPPDRYVRNLEIARRLAAGESGTSLAREYGMTHQNVYFIGNKYKSMAVCPSG